MLIVPILKDTKSVTLESEIKDNLLTCKSVDGSLYLGRELTLISPCGKQHFADIDEVSSDSKSGRLNILFKR